MKPNGIETLTGDLAKLISRVVLPKQDAPKCDLRYLIREQRLGLQRQVDALQKLETSLNEYFIENLPKSQASGIAGKIARVQLARKVVPQIEDIDLLHKYIAKTGAFDLLQRRLNNSAVEERWTDKKQIPGVQGFTVVTVSCTKL